MQHPAEKESFFHDFPYPHDISLAHAQKLHSETFSVIYEAEQNLLSTLPSPVQCSKTDQFFLWTCSTLL